MNINELKAFITVVDSGSVTQAAARLHRVQSSVSQRIKNLEDLLGVSLLTRHADGVAPTAHGLILYDYAVKVVDLIQDCTTTIGKKPDERNVRIGIIECLPPSVVNAIIDLNEVEGFNVGISVGNTLDILSAFENDDLDMAIIGSGFASQKHARLPLLTDDLVLISNKKAKPINEISNLDNMVFLLSSKKAASLRNFSLLFEEGEILPKRIIECGSYPALFSKVIEGKGVSLVLNCSINSSVRNELKIHDLRGKFSRFQIDLVSRRGCMHPSTAALQKMISAIFRNQRLTPGFGRDRDDWSDLPLREVESDLSASVKVKSELV